MRPSYRAGPLGAVGLVVTGLICQEAGAAFAITLFPALGPIATVAVRLMFSAIILMAVFRPRLRGRTRRDWLIVVAFGLVLASMNILFYESLARLDLGAAVTIEFLGPLILAVVVSRKASSWLWALLAFAGVALLGRGGFESLDPIGVAFALAAGGAWVGYILLSARTGGRFERLDGLAIAMSVGRARRAHRAPADSRDPGCRRHRARRRGHGRGACRVAPHARRARRTGSRTAPVAGEAQVGSSGPGRSAPARSATTSLRAAESRRADSRLSENPLHPSPT